MIFNFFKNRHQETQAAILLAMSEMDASTGAQIRQRVESIVGRSVSIGAFYVLMERLENDGLISGYDFEVNSLGKVRRVFYLTRFGQTVAA